MGRKARYLTLAEKTAALHRQKVNHAQSERGKATRRLRRSQNYAKAHSHKGSSKPPLISSQLPPLPRSLINLAVTSLPDGELFHLTSQSADNLDESELPQWDNNPPYTMPPPSDTRAEVRFTENLVQVMHGRNSHLEKEELQQCVQKYTAGVLNLCTEMKDAIGVLLGQWYILQDYISGTKDCDRHFRMAQCLLQWRARRIYLYHTEVQKMLSRLNPYI
ncbi:uncharacterized protein F5147DRAFT_770285 [Suillus discolor]|uniref:Uncharacterized protein n=1 Tax=Suillus discolor TaxID=1912936 RepID=A0A9P7FCV6_9AGAM|nr:uncharacterized protein F5147DRAFT_770285 [Suillus discolor]KAG2114307.1 hypothetical protein F5147DRAFT_770285 [Suillus discolor]